VGYNCVKKYTNKSKKISFIYVIFSICQFQFLPYKNRGRSFESLFLELRLMEQFWFDASAELHTYALDSSA